MLPSTHSETHVLISICTPENAYPRFYDAILSTKYFDDESELAYYGYRYYSPEMGRWVSRDPIGQWGGINLYIIGNNAPISGVDVLGLLAIDMAEDIVDAFLREQDPVLEDELITPDRATCAKRMLHLLRQNTTAGLMWDLGEIALFEPLKSVFPSLLGSLTVDTLQQAFGFLTSDSPDPEAAAASIVSAVTELSPMEESIAKSILEGIFQTAVADWIGEAIGDIRVVNRTTGNWLTGTMSGYLVDCTFFVSADVDNPPLLPATYSDFVIHGDCGYCYASGSVPGNADPYCGCAGQFRVDAKGAASTGGGVDVSEQTISY